MAEAKHTPGPWFVSASGATVYALHGEPPRNRFSALPQAGRRDDAGPEELMANASLMAAAPVMHDALQKALAYLEPRLRNTGGEGESVVLPAIRAAIAQATGEPK